MGASPSTAAGTANRRRPYPGDVSAGSPADAAARSPDAITRAEPTVGRSAATPGNCVASSRIRPETTTITNPAQPIQGAAPAGTSRLAAGRARSAPSASSHALVGSEKNAHGCATSVSHIEAASDRTNVATRAMARCRSPARTWPPRNAAPDTSRSSAGQNR
jgi:hypothetical protein